MKWKKIGCFLGWCFVFPNSSCVGGKPFRLFQSVENSKKERGFYFLFQYYPLCLIKFIHRSQIAWPSSREGKESLLRFVWASFMEWMTFRNSFDRTPKTFDDSVFLDRQYCIFRTGRRKSTAVSHKWA